MAQETSISTTIRQRHNLKQYAASTLVESNGEEIEKIIRDKEQENIALDVVYPSEGGYDQGAEEGDAGLDDGRSETSDERDTSISDSERGEAVKFDNDDDEPIDTSSNQGGEESTRNPLDVLTESESFREDLKRQADMLKITDEERYLTDEERYLTYYLIDSLDDDGYLRRPLGELAVELEMRQQHETTVEDLEYVLVEIIQDELEPRGVGARNLRECLLLQLEECKGRVAQLAYAIVDRCFDALAAKRYDRIEQSLGIVNHSDLVDALRIIRHCNPKPGNMQPETPHSGRERVQQVRPDFIVRNEDGRLVVTLNDRFMPEVRVSSEQEQELGRLQKEAERKGKEASAGMHEGIKFIKDRMKDANDFIQALKERNNTLITVMQTIVTMQRAYFLSGEEEDLVPMTLQDVEDRCHYDISTISRVSNSKYVDTEFGIIPVKALFTNAVDDTNQRAVMQALKEIIDAEDKHHPLTDEKLAAALHDQQSIDISRRTVVKYREKLGYLKASQRKEA